MSSIIVTKKTGGLSFQIHEGRPYGIPDVHRRIELLSFEAIPSLKRVSDAEWKERMACAASIPVSIQLYWVPESRAWIGFYLSSYQERSTGPNEEDYTGPFWFFQEEEPSAEEMSAIDSSQGAMRKR